MPGTLTDRAIRRAPRFRSWAFAALVTAGVVTVNDARADGGLPRAQEILFEPGNPSHIVVRSEYWGLFESRDAGRTWVLICSEAFGGRALNQEKFPTVVAAGGRILVGAAFAGLQMSDDGCNFRVAANTSSGSASLVAQSVSALDATGRNFAYLGVQGSDGGVTSQFFLTSDRGDTWSLGATLPHDFAASSVSFAPSDPQRVYASGVVVGGSTNGGRDLRALEVSQDGGQSWQPRALPVGGLDPSRIVAVHPTRPDSLLVRIDGNDQPGDTTPDELWSTADAGRHWVRMHLASGDLPGFTFSPDGASVLIAGPNDGLQSASLASVFGTQPEPFNELLFGQAYGLAVSRGKLYVGTDQFAPGGTPRATVQVTSDGARSFSPVFDLCSVTFPKCAATSTVERTCRVQWERQGGFVTDFLQMGVCAPDAGVVSGTGGATGSGGTNSGGGGSAPRGGEGGAATGGNVDTDATPSSKPSDRRLRIATVQCSAAPARAPAVPASVVVVSLALAGALLRRRRG